VIGQALNLFWKACRGILKLVYRWLWTEPVNARGVSWTLLLWLALLCLASLIRFLARSGGQWVVPALLFGGACWLMNKLGKPKNPARPHFRRRR
jgi:hypothetical protein